MNQYIPSPRPTSSGNLLVESSIFKTDKSVHWSMQKELPRHIAAERVERAAKLELIHNRAQLAAARPEHLKVNSGAKGIFAQTLVGGFKVLGFGVVVPTINDLFELAVKEKRTIVKVDGNEISYPL